VGLCKSVQAPAPAPAAAEHDPAIGTAGVTAAVLDPAARRLAVLTGDEPAWLSLG